jgi:hypothetical protein
MTPKRVPEGYVDDVQRVEILVTLGQKVNDVTTQLRGLGELLGMGTGIAVKPSETYIDEIITQIEECRSWVQNIRNELEKL